jgi:hypothetical protein
MSKENVLKKQFAEKDVNRLRNLVKGKHADKSQVSIGYYKRSQSSTHTKVMYGTKATRRGRLRMVLNKMLPNLIKRVKRSIFQFFARLVKNR